MDNASLDINEVASAPAVADAGLFGPGATKCHLPILIAASALLWILPGFLWDIRGPDEGRYVQIAKEILASGNWLELTLQGLPYDQKPPLTFWLLALMIKAGNGALISGLLRLPSAVSATIIVAMTYLLGRRFWSARAGWFAACALMTSFGFYDDAPTIELNMLFTAPIIGAIYLWLTRPNRDSCSWPRARASSPPAIVPSASTTSPSPTMSSPVPPRRARCIAISWGTRRGPRPT